MKSKNVITFIVSMILVIIVGLMACKKNSEIIIPFEKYVNLGVILPMDLEKGLLRENALRLAINEINSSGGVGDDYKINLVVGSSEGPDRKIAATVAAMEIIEQIPNLVGFVSSFSSSSLGIVDNISIPGHFPTISGSATSKELSGISEYFQRLCPPDGYAANVLSDRAKLYGISSVAIAVEVGDAYAVDMGSSFQQAYGAGSETLVNFTADDPDYDAKLDLLLDGNPEALFISMLNPDEFTTFFTKLGQIGRKGILDSLTFILCDGLYGNELFQAPIDYMLGEINGHPKNFGTFPSADTASETYMYFQTKLWEQYEQEVAAYNAQFYDIGYIYALALEKTFQDMDILNIVLFREKLADYIRPVSHGGGGATGVDPTQGWSSMKIKCQAGSVDYTGASGNCNIDDEGNAITPYALFKVVKTGNDYGFSIIEIIP